MCTAISLHGERHLFGRTLDLECSYNESAVVTPRNFRFDFINEEASAEHAAIMGIASVQNGMPLYYDAVNEFGLAAAGLNFPMSTEYHSPISGKQNIASFEFIPWVLTKCKTATDAVDLLQNTNITTDSFSSDLPVTPLHWMISDKERSITVEAISCGLQIYENPFGVLTNEPQFTYHTLHLSDFMQLTSCPPKNQLSPSTVFSHYSRGMGAIGLPGDFSSSSRFVRAFFAKENSVQANSDYKEISRFFHIMDVVSIPSGCVKTEEGKNVRTIYTSCADTDAGIYYYTTYKCRRICAVKFGGHNLNSTALYAVLIDGEEDVAEM